MMKSGEMYKRSGGTNWKHQCKECRNLVYSNKDKKCMLYPGTVNWNENYIACKFFQEKVNEHVGQMNIFDYL